MDLIADLMTTNPLVVAPNTPLAVCARNMNRHRIRHLPVVSDDGAPLGIITDVVCFRHGSLVGMGQELWVSYDPAEFGMVASDVMVPIEVVARRDDTVKLAFLRMLKSPQDFVLVVDDDNKLVGIVTEHDGVRVAATVLQRVSPGTESRKHVHVTSGRSPADEAMARMDSYRIRHMAVVDDGELMGVISRGDMIADNVAGHRGLNVEDVMRERTLHTVTVSDPIATAAGLMMVHRIGCTPVLEDCGRLVGILTRTDLIEATVATLEQSDIFPMLGQMSRSEEPGRVG